MKNMKEIRFITTNYYNLQGLRLIPLGLLIVYVGYWANTAHYPVENAAFIKLIGVMALVLVAAFGIDRYYRRAFGTVKQTPECRRMESTLWTVGGVLATAAFWLDVTYKISFSLVGLVAGLALIADYVRMTRLVGGKALRYYPIGAVIILLVSLLPLFGLPGWWHSFGIRSQMFVIVFLLGLFTLVAGIWSHFFLVKTLRSNQEAQ
jgi:hypothetical protein